MGTLDQLVKILQCDPAVDHIRLPSGTDLLIAPAQAFDPGLRSIGDSRNATGSCHPGNPCGGIALLSSPPSPSSISLSTGRRTLETKEMQKEEARLPPIHNWKQSRE